jgi:hypothetical protein
MRNLLDGGGRLRRLLWTNMFLGLWLMISPFVLLLIYPGGFRATWQDLILGFGIATFSLCRLLSHSHEEILVTDWVVTTTGILTLINPLLYNYYGITLATWNNLIVGAAVLLLAIYQDLKDSGQDAWYHGHHQAH